jgi:hypothetical protein
VHNNRRLNRGEHAASRKHLQEKKQHIIGVGGQLQRIFFNPGGFQQQRKGAHEKELMISQQWSMMQEHHSTSTVF